MESGQATYDNETEEYTSGKGQCFIHVHYLDLINKELVQNPQGTMRERGEWHIKIGDEDQDKGRIVWVNEIQCTSQETQKEQ